MVTDKNDSINYWSCNTEKKITNFLKFVRTFLILLYNRIENEFTLYINIVFFVHCSIVYSKLEYQWSITILYYKVFYFGKNRINYWKYYKAPSNGLVMC